MMPSVFVKIKEMLHLTDQRFFAVVRHYAFSSGRQNINHWDRQVCSLKIENSKTSIFLTALADFLGPAEPSKHSPSPPLPPHTHTQHTHILTFDLL